MRDITVEEQVQCVLSYVQGGSADIQKKNVMEDLESRSLSYVIVGKFLLDLKKEFRSGNNKTIKMAELRKVEQESKMIGEFVQKFRRVARDSKYKGKPLVEEFKRRMNGTIC